MLVVKLAELAVSSDPVQVNVTNTQVPFIQRAADGSAGQRGGRRPQNYSVISGGDALVRRRVPVIK